MTDRGHQASLLYHQRLLADAIRVSSFERALRELVRPGDVVLDLGTGTGLLAMLAARRGAARVHAVESMPVAELARELVAANRLEDRVTVWRADIHELEPPEPVDLVVGDFLGRFLVDDGMLGAMRAAGAWLKPDGRFCPSHIRLLVAPVGMAEFEPLDSFTRSLLGLDLRPARVWARHEVFGASLPAGCELAPPAEYQLTTPPDTVEPFDRELDFVFGAPGRLRALAGWFEATLSANVVLTTAPGVETHWGQQIFPLPPVDVEPGDQLRVRLRSEGAEDASTWHWSGRVERRTAPAVPFELSSHWPPRPQLAVVRPEPEGDARHHNELGCDAFRRGASARAAEHFEAAVAALTPAEDAMAADVYENLGTAYHQTGCYSAAITALLRACDGDLAAREQTARLLVDACFQSGRSLDGQRFLEAYEEHFGPHPSGWRRT